MAVFEETRYDERQLRRNRVIVGLLVLGGVGACIAGGAMTSWPWTNAIATSVVVLVFGACFWWAFASAKAGSVKLTELARSRMKQTFWPN
jgi:membrane protein implicated in regulation of membrane protease activity